jgi:hypothetical protein
VGRTALVVAREDCVEFDDAVSGGLLAVSGGMFSSTIGGCQKRGSEEVLTRRGGKLF